MAAVMRRPKQERSVARYNALLDAAHELLKEHEVDEVGLYNIAEKADVPPASAYHFFPTQAAVFLTLAERYHATFQEITLKLDPPPDGRWQTLLRRRLEAAASIYNANPPMLRLLLGSHSIRELTLAEAGFNELMACKLIEMYEGFFRMPIARPEAERKCLIMLTLVDAVWSLSYAKHRCIVPEFLEESTLVAIAYMRTYLPERIDLKERRCIHRI